MINMLIWPTDPKDEDAGHDLADVVQNKKACCQGDALLYFVLGNAIGLSTGGLEVSLMAGGPIPTGTYHDACVVHLADGDAVIADATANLGRNALVSPAFTFDGVYRKRQLPIGRSRTSQRRSVFIVWSCLPTSSA